MTYDRSALVECARYADGELTLQQLSEIALVTLIQLAGEHRGEAQAGDVSALQRERADDDPALP